MIVLEIASKLASMKFYIQEIANIENLGKCPSIVNRIPEMGHVRKTN